MYMLLSVKRRIEGSEIYVYENYQNVKIIEQFIADENNIKIEFMTEENGKAEWNDIDNVEISLVSSYCLTSS